MARYKNHLGLGLAVASLLLAACVEASAQSTTILRQANGAAAIPATSAGLAVQSADGNIASIGAEADAACSTDNGTCGVIELLKRQNQRLTSAITAIGNSFQIGGSIGNTTFASTQSGTWNVGITGTPTVNIGTISTIATAAKQDTLQTSATALTAIAGTPADSVCGTDAGTCTEAALIKRTNTVLSTLKTAIDSLNAVLGTTADAAWASGNGTLAAYAKATATSAVDTTPAQVNKTQTNGVAVPTGAGAGTNTERVTVSTDSAGVGATAAAVPATASYLGANSAGNLTGLIQADVSGKIDMSTATTTQLVALSSGKKIYVTAWDVIAGGTGIFKFVYGTGTNCGTGTTDATGPYPLTAQSGLTKGTGLGPVLVIPASQALCAYSSAAVVMAGSYAATQAP